MQFGIFQQYGPVPTGIPYDTGWVSGVSQIDSGNNFTRNVFETVFESDGAGGNVWQDLIQVDPPDQFFLPSADPETPSNNGEVRIFHVAVGFPLQFHGSDEWGDTRDVQNFHVSGSAQLGHDYIAATKTLNVLNQPHVGSQPASHSEGEAVVYAATYSGDPIPSNKSLIISFDYVEYQVRDGFGNLLRSPTTDVHHYNFYVEIVGRPTLSVVVPITSVERFFDSATGDHFYTLSPAEAAQIRATLPTYHDEGAPWSVPDVGSGTQNVYRFFDVITNAHFFTDNATERDNIINTPSLSAEYHYEGVAFQEYTASGPDTLTLERFFNTISHLHTYGASAAENTSIRSGGAGPGWVDEGPSFIVHA